jgi:glycosyltransferase involved in cell wall biosynthesis
MYRPGLNQSLKILIAVHHFPPTFRGGAEWRAYRTAKWFQNQGHQVKVICVESINDSTTSSLRWQDETFEGIAVRRLFLNLAQASDLARWEYDNPWIEKHLTDYLAEEKPDIFHLISGYLMTAAAIKAAKASDTPVILTLTDFWFLCPRITLQRTSGQVCPENTSLDCVRCEVEKRRRFQLPAKIAPLIVNAIWSGAQALPSISKRVEQVDERRETLRAALSEVDIAVCPSEFLRDVYLSKGFKAQQMRFLRQGLVHPPGVPVKKPASSRLRIGYIGQIASHKGVHVLVEAFCKLESASSQAVLKIYGDEQQFPGYYEKLQALAGNQPDIQFLGAFDNLQITDIYRDIDVLVAPSLWYENSPNVILEAFAHQTPVIASNLGGMAELVTDQKTGFLFAAHNSDDLAQRLHLIIKKPWLLNEMSKNISPPPTLEVEMNQLLQIYQAALVKQRIN